MAFPDVPHGRDAQPVRVGRELPGDVDGLAARARAGTDAIDLKAHNDFYARQQLNEGQKQVLVGQLNAKLAGTSLVAGMYKGAVQIRNVDHDFIGKFDYNNLFATWPNKDLDAKVAKLQPNKDGVLHPDGTFMGVYDYRRTFQENMQADWVGINAGLVSPDLQRARVPLTKRFNNPEDQKRYDAVEQKLQPVIAFVDQQAKALKVPMDRVPGATIKTFVDKNYQGGWNQFVEDSKQREILISSLKITHLEDIPVAVEMYMRLYDRYKAMKTAGLIPDNDEGKRLEAAVLKFHDSFKVQAFKQVAVFDEFASVAPPKDPGQRISRLDALHDSFTNTNNDIIKNLRAPQTNGIMAVHSLLVLAHKTQYLTYVKEFHVSQLKSKVSEQLQKASDGFSKFGNKEVPADEAEKILKAAGYDVSDLVKAIEQYKADALRHNDAAKTEKAKEVDQFRERCRKNVESLAALNAELLEWQVHFGELNARRHVFGQPMKFDRTPGQPLPVGIDLQKPYMDNPEVFAALLDEQVNGSIATINTHLNFVRDKVLQDGWLEFAEDLYVKHGRRRVYAVFLKVIGMETALLPTDVAGINVQQMANDMLSAGFDDMIRWPRNEDGSLMTDDQVDALRAQNPKDERVKIVDDLEASVHDALQKFQKPRAARALNGDAINGPDGKPLMRGNAMDNLQKSNNDMAALLTKYPVGKNAANLLTIGPQSAEQLQQMKDFLEGKTDTVEIGAIPVPPELLQGDSMPLVEIADKYGAQVAYIIAFMRIDRDTQEYNEAYRQLAVDLSSNVELHRISGLWLGNVGKEQLKIVATLLFAALMALVGVQAAWVLYKAVRFAYKNGKWVMERKKSGPIPEGVSELQGPTTEELIRGQRKLAQMEAERQAQEKAVLEEEVARLQQEIDSLKSKDKTSPVTEDVKPATDVPAKKPRPRPKPSTEVEIPTQAEVAARKVTSLAELQKLAVELNVNTKGDPKSAEALKTEVEAAAAKAGVKVSINIKK